MIKLISIIENYDSEKNTHSNQGYKKMKCEKCSTGKFGIKGYNYSFCPFCGESLKNQTLMIGNLMWQSEDDGIKRNWKEAVEYANSLCIDGHSDWRLPTINELISIVDYEKSNPAINTYYFHGRSSYYWSCTTLNNNTCRAWYVNFGYGDVGFDDKTHNYYVRCLR